MMRVEITPEGREALRLSTPPLNSAEESHMGVHSKIAADQDEQLRIDDPHGESSDPANYHARDALNADVIARVETALAFAREKRFIAVSIDVPDLEALLVAIVRA